MGAILWSEINSYADAIPGRPMRFWEKEMIRELDDIARGVWMNAKTGDKGPKMVSLKDSDGVDAVMRKLEAKKHG